MNQNRKRIVPWACIAPLAVAMSLTGCGGGGGGSSSGGTTDTSNRSFTVPAEISAVPASSSSSNSSSVPRSFGSAVRALAKAATVSELASTTDYHQTKGKTYVEERTLEQFDIIEQVFKAVGQTNYADEVGNGPYKAVVSWEEESDGKDVKQLQTWTVQSDLVSGTFPDGTTGQYLRLRAWIPETDPSDGTERLIKAQFDIFEDVTQDDSGAYTDFGTWDMNVLFDADANAVDTNQNAGYFAAQARKTSTGGATLKIHEEFAAREFGAGGYTKAILIRDGDSGYGQVQFPDFDACWSDFQTNGGGDPNNYTCNLQYKTAQYAYTDRDLVVSPDGGTTKTFKDRNLNGAIKMVHRYGLFYADAGTVNGQAVAAGENVEKKTSFGFPVNYQAQAQNSSTFTAFAYYGAWQGRHSLWGPGGYTAVGGGSPTTFNRADLAPGATAVDYQLKEFAGTFTKRGLVDASLLDIKNVPSQTFVNKHFDLFYAGGEWKYCPGIVRWDTNPISCDGRDGTQGAGAANEGFQSAAALLPTLEVTQNDQRWVNIGRDNGGNFTNYLYLTANPSVGGLTWGGAGFYPAEFGNNGLTPKTDANGGGLYTPNVNDQMFVDVGGSIFVEFVGFSGPGSTATGWVQKTVSGFDQQTGNPTFSGQSNYSPERGVEYYINANGSNFIVKRKADGDAVSSYDVKLELQTAANPANTSSTTPATILPTSTSYLAFPWDKSVRFKLIEDPADANYLLLEVLADDTGTLNPGDVVDDSKWGLVAYNASNQMLDASGAAVTVDAYGFPTGGTRPAEFMWEKPRQGENWGKQQFLCHTNCTQYVVLNDPIFLNSVGVVDSIDQVVYVKNPDGTDTATPKTFNLQFDGWMHGLPDMYRELSKNGWSMTPEIAGKVVHVKEGTKATDTNSVSYFIKPLDTSLFLGQITEQSIVDAGRTPPSLASVATNADLSSVPTYAAHQMGATPTDSSVIIKYSEGKEI